MSQTPTNSPEAIPNFIPRELSTPNKDHPGVSKIVFTHLSNLQGFINDWNRNKDKGVRLCRGIIALKLHECADNYYPQQMKPLMEGLVEALTNFKNILGGVEVLNTQLQAVSKLQPSEDPVILTWSSKRISETVDNIYTSMQKEYKLKLVITENIAHCRDEKLIEVYVSSWELEPYFEPNAYLFAEVGLHGVT